LARYRRNSRKCLQPNRLREVCLAIGPFIIGHVHRDKAWENGRNGSRQRSLGAFMLTELRLQNYRGFRDHIIPFRAVSVIVGRNNAGKSTIVEALRLVSLVVSRHQSLNFCDVPDWLDIPRRCRGVAPSLRNMDFNFRTVFHGYSKPPAVIVASFLGGEKVTVYLGAEEQLHAVLEDRLGRPVGTKGQAAGLNLPQVSILPQVAPVSQEETILSPDYVRSNLSSSLAPLHFRNQLNILYADYFDQFRTIAEETWKGLRIRELAGQGKLPGEQLDLLVQDKDFPAEIAWMGHGLQMWLQTMWFLARRGASTVILDEPDVYMHADLQRKLIRFIRERHPQTIVATHSVEIMTEVRPDEILIVDRARKRSNFASSLPAVQKVVDHVGGVHNLQLARLWTARRCLFVEGDDIGILKHLHKSLFSLASEPLDLIPNIAIGGWGGWNYAVGSSMLLKNAVGDEITIYCLFDRDYRSDEEIQERSQDAKKRNVQLHVWKRKEIENYLFVPGAIQRIIDREIRSKTAPPELTGIVDQANMIAEELKDQTVDALADALIHRDKKSGLTVANTRARERVKAAWQSSESRLAIISGKELISRLSAWSQDAFGVSISVAKLAQELKTEEIATEVVDVLAAIENGKAFV
jgi:hypothetical protein